MLRLKQVMAQQGWTQARLSEALGITSGYMSLLVKGGRAPSPAMLQRIAEVLGVALADLFSDPAARATGFDEQATPFDVSNRAPRRVAAAATALCSGLKSSMIYRAETDSPALSICRDDLLVVDLKTPPTPGDLVLASALDDTGAAYTLIRRFLPPWLISGAPCDPPDLMDDSGTLGIMGTISAVVRTSAKGSARA